MEREKKRKNEIPALDENSFLGANGRSKQEEKIVQNMRYSNPTMEVENSNDLMRQLDILKYQIESKQDNKIKSDFAYSNEYLSYIYEDDVTDTKN